MVIKNYPAYMINKDGSIFNSKTNKHLKATINSQGYAAVTLRDSGVSRKYLLHILVANHYLSGKKPGATVNHIDMGKSNNNVDNLEWCTHQENVAKAHAAGAYNDRVTKYSHKKHSIHNASDYPNCTECVLLLKNDQTTENIAAVS